MYPEASDNQSRTDGNIVYGVSKQNVTYIPTAEGPLEIPPVEMAWWNTRSNAAALASLPARELKVEPGVGKTESNVAPGVPARSVAQATAPPVSMTADQPLPSSPLSERLQSHWAWLAGGAASLAIVMLSVVAIQRSRRSASTVPVASAPQRRSAARALHEACIANDRHAAARVLLDLARAKWPNDPPRGLSALAARLEVGRSELIALDRSLYGADGSRWDGSAFWDVFRRGLQPKRSETWREDDGVAALYL